MAIELMQRRNVIYYSAKKKYIADGYKDVEIKVTDGAVNLNNYTLPLLVSQ